MISESTNKCYEKAKNSIINLLMYKIYVTSCNVNVCILLWLLKCGNKTLEHSFMLKITDLRFIKKHYLNHYYLKIHTNGHKINF